jgi:hypothetical protein
MSTKKFDRKYRPHPEYRFWLYDPEGDGMTFYRTADERDEAGKSCIDDYLDDCWCDQVEYVCAGEVTHAAHVLNKTMRPADDELDEEGCDGEGNYWEPDMAWRGTYKLEPIAALAAKQESNNE